MATDPKTGKAVGGKGSAAKARRRCVKDRFMHLTNYSVRHHVIIRTSTRLLVLSSFFFFFSFSFFFFFFFFFFD